MQPKVRIIIIAAVLVTASLFGVYWITQYLQRSRASATAPTASFVISGPKVNPGESFDLTLQLNPNLTPFYAFDLAFTYDPAKVSFKIEDPANIGNNIAPLSTKGAETPDITLLRGVSSTNIDTTAHVVRITGLRVNGATDPFTGRDPLKFVKVSFVMNAGAVLPLDFKWVDPNPAEINGSDSFEKINLSYTGEVEAASNLTPYACGADDFSTAAINANFWDAWTGSPAGNDGTLAHQNGKLALTIPKSTVHKGVSLRSKTPIAGDFVAELTLGDHSTLNEKLTSNLFFQFHNTDWSQGVSILKAYNKAPGEIVVGWLEGKDQWKDMGKNDGVDHNSPVRIKIERIGSTYKLYYNKMDGSGFKLLKQLDNYYTGVGHITFGLDNWGPDFPQASGTFDDFKLTCYRANTDTNPVEVPTLAPTGGVVQPTGAYNSLTPVPTIMGSSGKDATTTKITERKDLLYINSIASYQSPFRYEQAMKLAKGTYSLRFGAKIYVRKERGVVVAIVCNDTKCGVKNKGQMMYVSSVFPVKAEFSELADSFTIPDDADNKQYILRVFCEDGSECELDYITIEDAWGTQLVKNDNFQEVTQMSDPRKQPQSWEVDATANLYGSIDAAFGKNGALMINNSAK